MSDITKISQSIKIARNVFLLKTYYINRYQKDVKFCSCIIITAYLCRRILKSV